MAPYYHIYVVPHLQRKYIYQEKQIIFKQIMLTSTGTKSPPSSPPIPATISRV